MSASVATLDLLNAMEARLRALLPVEQVPTVKRHHGKFGAAEVETYSVRSPAVILTTTGSDTVERLGGVVRIVWEFAIFVVTKAYRGETKSDAAIAIVELLKRFIPFESWCTTTAVRNPENVKSANLNSSKLDALGVTLWMIQWDQAVELDGLAYDCDGNPPTFDDFTDFVADYQLEGSLPDTEATQTHTVLPTEGS